MALSLKKNDVVSVIKGKDRGKTGKILSIVSDGKRVLVEKLNLVKKHKKPDKTNPQGGIIEKESSIAIANVMYFCGKCTKPVRLGVKKLANGKKVRVCKKCSTELDKA